MELSQKKLEREVAETREQIAAVKENVVVEYDNWREWINSWLAAIGGVLGDYKRSRMI